MSDSHNNVQTLADTTATAYYNRRMALLGIAEDTNSIEIKQTETRRKSADYGNTILKPFPIFTPTERGIDILVYTLDRHIVRYASRGSRHKNHIYKLTRLFPEIPKEDGSTQKYSMPAGQPTLPFFSPQIVVKFEQKEQIPVLYLTEGYFKAFKATMHGIDCVGLPSITLMTDRETNELYSDVKELIATCNVQRIVWLLDGDCFNLTSKDIEAGVNLYTRPAAFCRSVTTFYDLVSDYRHIDKYFAFINSSTLAASPKGLDDLLCAFPEETEAIATEFNSFSKKVKQSVLDGKYLTRVDITNGKKAVYDCFHLNDVDAFFTFYKKSRPELATAKQFNFRGSYYAYDETEQKCVPTTTYPPETQNALDLVKTLCNPSKWDNNGNVKDIVILHSNFNDLLYSYGFRRFDIDRSNYIIVKIANNVLEKVAPVQVQDTFFRLLELLPDEIHDKIPRQLLKEKFTRGRETYFSYGNLSLLKNDKDYTFCKDTKDEVYIFYKNGFVSCTPGTWQLHPLSELKTYIWREQMLLRDFVKADITDKAPSIFQQFIINVCDKKHDRYNALCSMLGYMMHSYFDTKRKALILTDSEISESPSGRTGKGLLLQALKRIKPTETINGKDFKTDEKFKYQDVSLETQIVGIDDAKSNVKIEDFFNDIVEGLKVEKKNQTPFKTNVKLLITTNKTIKIEGASAKDRVIEFEMSGHYSDKYSPADEFGKWFFTEFTESDWQGFDNFMCYCIGLYLDKGLIPAKSINLELRKLIDQTNEDFVNWMDDKVQTGTIIADADYDKKELHAQFLAAYPDHKERSHFSKQRKFTESLKAYANYSGKFAPFDKKNDERRSSGKDFIIFRKKQAT